MWYVFGERMTLLVVERRTWDFWKDIERESRKEDRGCWGHTCLILSVTQFRCVTFDHLLIWNSKLSMRCIQDLHLSVAHRRSLVVRGVWLLSVSHILLQAWINISYNNTINKITLHQAPICSYGKSDFSQNPSWRRASLEKVPEIHNLFSLIPSSGVKYLKMKDPHFSDLSECHPSGMKSVFSP